MTPCITETVLHRAQSNAATVTIRTKSIVRQKGELEALCFVQLSLLRRGFSTNTRNVITQAREISIPLHALYRNSAGSWASVLTWQPQLKRGPASHFWCLWKVPSLVRAGYSLMSRHWYVHDDRASERGGRLFLWCTRYSLVTLICLVYAGLLRCPSQLGMGSPMTSSRFMSVIAHVIKVSGWFWSVWDEIIDDASTLSRISCSLSHATTSKW